MFIRILIGILFLSGIQGQKPDSGFPATNNTGPGTPIANQSVREMKFFGDHTIDAGVVSEDKIRIIGGNLFVYGTVDGVITVVGGDVFLYETALIRGKIIAIGGSIHTEEGATITGSVIETNIKEGLIYREYEQEETLEGETEFGVEALSKQAQFDWIFPDPDVLTYNRNEGLVLIPINPSWNYDGKSPYRLTLNLGYRFGQDMPVGQVGFERRFGMNRHLVLFLGAFHLTKTDDGYRLPQSENTAANIIARQDWYDRWYEKGAQAGFGIDISFLKLKINWVAAEQDTFSVIEAWSLFQNNRALRPNFSTFEPGPVKYIETTIALRTSRFHPFKTGFAGLVHITGYMDGGFIPNPLGDVSRIFALGILNWEFSPGLVLRTRLIGGTMIGDVPAFRRFSVGGLGSVAAYPYKVLTGEEMFQANIALYFTPDFLDESFTIYPFYDIGEAWLKTDHTFMDLRHDRHNMIQSVGLGISFNDDGDPNLGFTIATPLERFNTIDTTVRFNFPF
ncbi:MAG: BamA/TamA family outer membrane protein [Fidelibacterota bacterium]